MFELIYTSISKIPLGEKQCKNLLEHAQYHNKLNDITGMLLFDGYLFLQLLEGDKNKVLNLFDKIKKDPRHIEVDCLYTGSISERSYNDWSMGDQYFENGLIKQVKENQLKDIISPKNNLSNYGARLHVALLWRYHHLNKRISNL